MSRVHQLKLEVDRLKSSARMLDFAAKFNALADRLGVPACCVVFLPSSTKRDAVSVQIMGEVRACKVVEEGLRGAPSTYMGDHRRDDERAATTPADAPGER